MSSSVDEPNKDIETKKPNPIKRLLSWLKPTTLAKGMLLFALTFAVIGGSYAAYKSLAAPVAYVEHVGYEPKGHPSANVIAQPSSNLGATSVSTCSSVTACYFFATAYQQNINASGVSANYLIEKPKLIYDSHTLGEIAVMDTIWHNVIEIGWTVDQNLNGDLNPHLFVFHWIDGVGTCYNGCRFTPIASPYHAGMALSPGAVANFKILHDSTTHRWNLSVNGSIFGYYADSEWSNTFTLAQTTELFGEVAASNTNPLSDMGTGKLGGASGSASVRKISFYGTGSSLPNIQISDNGYNNLYRVGYINGQVLPDGFYFGGPGYKSVPAAGRVDAFARGGTNQLLHTWTAASDLWNGGFEDLGGTITGSPAVASWGTNRLDVFARDSNGNLIHKWFDGTAWRGWETFTDGVMATDPAVVSWGSGRIDIVARNSNNRLIHKWYDGTWHNWQTFTDGFILSNPTIASWASGRLDVVARGTDNHIYHKFYSGGWSSWEQVPGGGSTTDSPAAVSWGPNRLDIFVRGTDNHLYTTWYQNSWANQYVSLGGTLASAPAAASRGVGKIDVFARGTDNALWHKWYVLGWNDWESLGGQLTSAPGAVSWDN